VTDAGDVLFGRAEMERAFTALGERLACRGVVADDLALPYWWLNEQASIYISGKTSQELKCQAASEDSR
jgi:hypothetical protein